MNLILSSRITVPVRFCIGWPTAGTAFSVIANKDETALFILQLPAGLLRFSTCFFTDCIRKSSILTFCRRRNARRLSYKEVHRRFTGSAGSVYTIFRYTIIFVDPFYERSVCAFSARVPSLYFKHYGSPSSAKVQTAVYAALYKLYMFTTRCSRNAVAHVVVVAVYRQCVCRQLWLYKPYSGVLCTHVRFSSTSLKRVSQTFPVFVHIYIS